MLDLLATLGCSRGYRGADKAQICTYCRLPSVMIDVSGQGVWLGEILNFNDHNFSAIFRCVFFDSQ